MDDLHGDLYFKVGSHSDIATLSKTVADILHDRGLPVVLLAVGQANIYAALKLVASARKHVGTTAIDIVFKPHIRPERYVVLVHGTWHVADGGGELSYAFTGMESLQ